MADDDSLGFKKTPKISTEKTHSFTRTAELVLTFNEIIFGLICLGLLRYYYLLIPYISRFFLAIITTGGFTLISCANLMGSFMKGAITLQHSLISLVGTVLYVATGSISIDFYLRLEPFLELAKVGLVFGVLCIVNGFIYLLHAILAFRQHAKCTKCRYDYE